VAPQCDHGLRSCETDHIHGARKRKQRHGSSIDAALVNQIEHLWTNKKCANCSNNTYATNQNHQLAETA